MTLLNLFSWHLTGTTWQQPWKMQIQWQISEMITGFRNDKMTYFCLGVGNSPQFSTNNFFFKYFIVFVWSNFSSSDINDTSIDKRRLYVSNILHSSSYFFASLCSCAASFCSFAARWASLACSIFSDDNYSCTSSTLSLFACSSHWILPNLSSFSRSIWSPSLQWHILVF